MKKFTVLSAIALVVMIFRASYGEEPVYFPDTQLKIYVEKTLGKSDPTPTDMLSLTSLAASSKHIYFLTGLEYAANLEGIWLGGNRITDIQPLSGLTKLVLVDLPTNLTLSNIQPLSGLTNLEYLYLRRDPITDIQPLSNLTKLKMLFLDGCPITNIQPLSGLTNLTILYLSGDAISDISPLSGLTNLTCLELSNNLISDISPLAGLTNLDHLYLSGNPLNQDAFDIYIPLIRKNNPDIHIYYDPNAPQKPTVSTDPAASVGQTTATLRGRLENDGGEVCQYRFQYKKSGGSYSYTSWTGSVTTGQSFSEAVSGLTPGSTYYFDAQAKNTAGESEGNVQTFITLPGCNAIVSLLTPNGGEELVAGSTYEITWQTTGTTENVLLEYSGNNGVDWKAIATVPNTGSYEWEVPDVNNSQQCLVRISGAGCPNVNDTSDDVFTIFKCQAKLAGDLNGDCYVDFYDFTLFALDWLECGNPFDPNCQL